MISGLLITRISCSRRAFSFAAFYARRVRAHLPGAPDRASQPRWRSAPPSFLPTTCATCSATRSAAACLVANRRLLPRRRLLQRRVRPEAARPSLVARRRGAVLSALAGADLIAARQRVLVRAIVVVALVSLALFFVWLSEADPRAAFFLSPPRFWELLAGALLVRVSRPERWAGTAAASGLALIAASAVLIASETEFWASCCSCRPSARPLVVASPGRHFAARLLSSRVAVRHRPDQLSALSLALAAAFAAAQLRACAVDARRSAPSSRCRSCWPR